jgi:phosphomannomutase
MSSDGSLKFGTSGLRGRAADLAGENARRHVSAFLAYLSAGGRLGAGAVLVGRDLRASSPQIATDCLDAIAAMGLQPVDCGALPTPALALHAMAYRCPAIMVTGSHIPADRNGLKFYTAGGEIAKAEEAGIVAALARGAGDPPSIRSLASTGNSWSPIGAGLGETTGPSALSAYLDRCRVLLPPNALIGWRIGVFEHSSVARDILAELLTGFGAEVIRLGRSESFVAVDTEVPDDPVFAPLPGWIGAHRLDAIVSSDGDADRPLLVDGAGRFVRGDVLGILTARFVGTDILVTPVTANSAIEAHFPAVARTRVGSPYVIAAMRQAVAGGAKRVVGFEANGGVLLASPVAINGVEIGPLPTRDAVLPLLAALGTAAHANRTIADVVSALNLRCAVSGRLQDVPADRARDFLDGLRPESIATLLPAQSNRLPRFSCIDGTRFSWESGEVVHFRASGNAPELRCYVEAETEPRAAELLARSLAVARNMLKA